NRPTVHRSPHRPLRGGEPAGVLPADQSTGRGDGVSEKADAGHGLRCELPRGCAGTERGPSAVLRTTTQEPPRRAGADPPAAGFPRLSTARDPVHGHAQRLGQTGRTRRGGTDRKSTRLNSSHVSISYAVFCFKKKTLR